MAPKEAYLMLGHTPPFLYGRLGAVLSALIVVFCLIGMTLHPDFYAGRRRRDFYCYYTNVSNLVVLLYFGLAAPRLYASQALAPLIPHVEFIVTLCIMLTFTVFHLLLFPAVRPSLRGMKRTRTFSIMLVNNLIVHYIVPWLVFFYWLLCAPGKQALRIWDAPLFTLLPLGYLLFIFLRAPACGNICGEDSPYPYPFLNCRKNGPRRVMRTCLRLFFVCIACALGVLLCTRLAFVRWGAGHALILV